MRSIPLMSWLAAFAIANFAAGKGFAQSAEPPRSPADEFMRRQTDLKRAQRLNALQAATPEDSVAEAPPQVDKSEGPCFGISHVEVQGVTLLPQTALAPVLERYKNSCIGLADINTLLKGLTFLYVDKGYITSRFYVPEQDIAATKTLRLVATEGSLSDIYLNGKPVTAGGALATAFPGMRGRPVNIRDVEQGLDQINRLSSNNAKTAMLPGAHPGESILNVQNKPDKPWHLSAANNNLGQASTGYSQTSLSFSMDDLFDLNDLLSLSYQHTGPDYPWPNDGVGRSNSISGSFSVPYGYWTLSLNGSWYRYNSTIPGNFTDIETSGDSGQFGFSLDRVLMRDKDSITTLNTALNYKQTDNFLMGSRIEVGSRQYSVGSLGISHSRRMLGGVWVFDLGYSQGLDIFDAVKRGEPAAADAEPEFSKFSATLNVTTPFEISGQHLQYATVINGQYSPDNLFGAEQISLGGYSNIRGTRDSVLFGNNGVFMRNEIVWRTQPWASNALLVNRLGELRPYAGIDYGHVFGQERFSIESGDIASWTVGSRLTGGTINADLGYSHIFRSTADTSMRDLFFASAALAF
ncbi:ShlB/FhaC/HecB family hemolysin secretion/activation protein [Rhizobium sp. CF142]|uniref:ShlB/FhaC/HecB family hemolysin secretion/activation protein n=1 Tax=Rhizobium sp. CF142 TaxID=1144314 RepID=UPI00026EFC8C|nr:ShlB/FhaC/HecB family hemolysin secretion/activation protein [Rhizobium sp. CF142]EJJ31132.1 hemolysin activation/secretion protein [Rhizobium sp. CF142]